MNVSGRSVLGFKAARYAPLLLVLAAGACGDDPTSPLDEPDDEQDLLSIFAAPVTMSESPQLLENGDIEAGQSEPTPWWGGGSTAQEFEHDWAKGVAASGSRSLAIRPTTDPTNGFAFWAQTVPVDDPVGMTFELSVDVKLDDVLGDGIAIAIRGDDLDVSNGTAEVFATTQGLVPVTGTQDWKTLTVRLNSVPGEIDRLTVYLIHLPGRSGTAYFDDATLSASVSVPNVELRNTDVEDGRGYPEPWWWGGPGYANYAFAWSDDQASSGSRSLAISRLGSHPDEFGFWAQTIDARDFSGGSATLSVDVRTSGLTGGGAAIAVRADDTERAMGFAEAFATTQGSQSITGTGAWTTYEVTLDDVPANARSVTVYFIHLTDTSGTVYFDRASLTPG